jgi:hypothetical protein
MNTLMGVTQMWDQLTSADIGRARQELDGCRATTLSRHAEELRILEVKQTEEIEALHAKQAELELLDALVDSFTSEFKTETARSEGAVGADRGATEPVLVQHDVDPENFEADGVRPGEGPATPTSGPAPLKVGFPSPNFEALLQVHGRA